MTLWGSCQDNPCKDDTTVILSVTRRDHRSQVHERILVTRYMTAVCDAAFDNLPLALIPAVSHSENVNESLTERHMRL